MNRDRGEWLDQASCLGLTIAVVVIKISRNLIADQIPQGVENKKMGIPAKIAIANRQTTFFDQVFKQYEQSAEKLWNRCGKPLLDCGKRHLK